MVIEMTTAAENKNDSGFFEVHPVSTLRRVLFASSREDVFSLHLPVFIAILPR
jgi:hypothetical protein